MNVLCFDLSSGGLAAAVIDDALQTVRSAEIPWQIRTDSSGAATLEVDTLLGLFSSLSRRLCEQAKPDAVSFSCFMHSSTLLDEAGNPLIPIATWMDTRGTAGVELIRQEMGAQFHHRTGCRFHPMFPVFKMAEWHARRDPVLKSAYKVVSPKALLIRELTGFCKDDYGMASSSGMFAVEASDWDPDLLALCGLSREQMPDLAASHAIAGEVSASAADRYGLPEGIPVVLGSGDGFLANVGSACEKPARAAVTLGTSASVRQMLAGPRFDEQAGTFCYRAGTQSFLLGCAGNNGGNTLDWASAVLGRPESHALDETGPIFVPLLRGERSPDWNPALTASWHGIRASHTAADLMRSVVEGVVFNLVHYAGIVQTVSGEPATEAIVSGNGFLQPGSAEILAALLEAKVLIPEAQGLASLRGAAVCALRGVGVDPVPALEAMVAQAKLVMPATDPGLRKRYNRYRELR